MEFTRFGNVTSYGRHEESLTAGGVEMSLPLSLPADATGGKWRK